MWCVIVGWSKRVEEWYDRVNACNGAENHVPVGQDKSRKLGQHICTVFLAKGNNIWEVTQHHWLQKWDVFLPEKSDDLILETIHFGDFLGFPKFEQTASCRSCQHVSDDWLGANACGKTQGWVSVSFYFCNSTYRLNAEATPHQRVSKYDSPWNSPWRPSIVLEMFMVTRLRNS